MDLWIIAFAIAIVFFIAEIFKPNFLYISMGIGAVIAGLFLYILPGILFQLIIFVIFSVLVYIWLKKISPKLFIISDDKQKASNLLNKHGIVTKELRLSKIGYVKIGIDEWPAVSKDKEHIAKEKKVRVEEIAGGRLIVTESSTETDNK